MPFVLDASTAMAWAFEDEWRPSASVAYDRIRRDAALVPSLWWFEVRNTLIVGERRKRITEQATEAFLRHLSRLRVTLDHSPDESAILDLARRHKLTVYDAAYLDLARRENMSLATFDGSLIRAARAEKIPLI
jgi:predicted nucleic acid-binding protein